MSFKKQSIFACSPATQRGQAVHLSADPKGERFVYCNGRTIVIRSLDNPAVAQEYTEHSCQTTVARWSPSGFYIASGDVQGNVRIWDTVNEEHILKFTCRPITSKVNDISWDAESKRIIAVGDGKERYGAAFSFDSGSTVGDIIGHNKVANSCHIRSVRPYRAATCSDDMTVGFYAGPPYKFSKSITDHSRFVQCVRFSPDGQFMVTCGSDAKIYLYDGTTGDKIGELADGAHTGGVMSASWSPDSKQLITSSLDMSVKIWDVAAKKAVNTIQIGSTVDDQQVGNLWTQKHLLSLSLSGDYHYIDPKSDKPIKTVYGHQKSITAFSLSPADKTFYTGSYDGRMYFWDFESGTASPVSGKGHSSQVAAITQARISNKLFSVGFEDVLKSVDTAGKVFEETAAPTEGQPKAVVQSKAGVVVVGTGKEIAVYQHGKKQSSQATKFSCNAVALSADEKEVAVGGDDKQVHFFTVSADGNLTPSAKVYQSNRGQITALAYSPNGKYLAAADTDRKIVVYDTTSGQVAIEEWCFHSAKVNCFSWAEDSLHAVSGGLDRDIYVWSVEKPMKYIAIKGAHQDGVSGVAFLNNNTVVSTGADSCVKVWNVTHH
ncbi:hypothetical protein MIR68_006214 [Amoeboaphelidium protococcarum]|nr:hypothetical protein MIR68_006214 [Amoeboaphelidium protococcarum]